LLFAAFSRASISIATAVYNTQPFMLVGFGALLFSERLTMMKLAWLGIAFAGMILIVQAAPDAGSVGTNYFLGIAMALGAAFFWAVAAIVTKKLKGTPPHLIALIQVSVGVVMLAPFANLGHLPSNAWSWAMLATLGVVHTGLMYILLYGAIQKLPTYLQGSLSFIYPVVAIMVDVLAFGHRLHVTQIVGAAFILFAAAGMNLGWSLWRSKAPA
ncbi:MAG: DMT family transporter, partial [Mesorhizobium sp.]